MDFVYNTIWVDDFTDTREISYAAWTAAGTSHLGSVHYLSAFNQSVMQSGNGLLFYENWLLQRMAGLITGQWDLYPDPRELGPGTLAIPLQQDKGVAVDFFCSIPIDLFDARIFLENFGVGGYWGLWLDSGTVSFETSTTPRVDFNLVYTGATYRRFTLNYFNGRLVLIADRTVVVLDEQQTHVDTIIDSVQFSGESVSSEFSVLQFGLYEVILPKEPNTIGETETAAVSAKLIWDWNSSGE